MSIYYSPEEVGFEIFDEIETGGSWEFTTTAIFRNKETGKLYYSQDSGCSCPTPFDGVTVDDLIPLVSETFEEFKKAVKEHHSYEANESDFFDCFDKVRNYLNQ